MIIDDESLFYMLEMRMKTKRIVGTLCEAPKGDVLHNAMRHFDIWDSDGYISQPYVEITQGMVNNMTFDVFRAFIDLNDLYHPPFTMGEINSIIGLCKKFGYGVTHNKGYISIKREVMNEDICTRH